MLFVFALLQKQQDKTKALFQFQLKIFSLFSFAWLLYAGLKNGYIMLRGLASVNPFVSG